MTILSTIKNSLDIPSDETVFDAELLEYIQGVVIQVYYLGVDEFSGLTVDANLDWPELNGDLNSLVQAYVIQSVRGIFDPVSNVAIKETRDSYLNRTAALIMYKAREIKDVT